MNYLGHCFLTRHKKELIPGNLAGDFYKGDLENYKNVPKHILLGAEIHRYIDSTTDNSPLIQEAAHILQENGLKKISYISTDILIDHYLAQRWSKFTSKNQSKFIKKIYKLTSNEISVLPKEFSPMFKVMVEKDWLNRYRHDDGIDLTFHKLGSRLPFDNNLHETFPIYLKHRKELNKLFKVFLKEIDNSVSKKFSLK